MTNAEERLLVYLYTEKGSSRNEIWSKVRGLFKSRKGLNAALENLKKEGFIREINKSFFKN